MSLVSQYEASLMAEGLTSDPDQLRVLESLQRLTDELAQPGPQGLKRFFQRTVSRLTEMQTPAFLGRPHLG